MLEIGQTYHLDAESLSNEWVAYSTRSGGCPLELEMLDQWEGTLLKTTRKMPTSRRTIAKATAAKKKFHDVSHEDVGTLDEENLDEL